MKRLALLLVLIISLGVFLRFYQIASIPPGLYWDEAGIGYNAYSILLTGKDEWGKPWPVVFRSFDDYKLPAYIYLTAGSVKLFGLSEFAVRFPSALAGSLTLIVFYFLAQRLTSRRTALLALLFLTISPWHIQFSRAGFEANLSLFFLVTGTWLFLKRSYIFSLLVLVASVYSYYSATVVAPILVITLSLLDRVHILANRRQFLLAIFLALIFASPFIKNNFLSPEGKLRPVAESVFSMSGDPLVNATHNYAANFSLDYLFFHGDQNGRHSVKKIGELYLWQLPFFLSGLYLLISRKSKANLFILIWFLAAALPPALSKVSPHALRGLSAVPVFQIISAVGGILFLKRFRLLRFAAPIIVGFASFIYLHQYFVHATVEFAPDWQYGYREALEYSEKNKDRYNQIFLSHELPPIYVLFYTKYDPVLLHASDHNISHLGKYIYVKLPEPPPAKQDLTKKDLVIASSWMVEGDVEILRQISMPTGANLFTFYEL